jgi:hypothetical protein
MFTHQELLELEYSSFIHYIQQACNAEDALLQDQLQLVGCITEIHSSLRTLSASCGIYPPPFTVPGAVPVNIQFDLSGLCLLLNKGLQMRAGYSSGYHPTDRLVWAVTAHTTSASILASITYSYPAPYGGSGVVKTLINLTMDYGTTPVRITASTSGGGVPVPLAPSILRMLGQRFAPFAFQAQEMAVGHSSGTSTGYFTTDQEL